MPLIPALQSQKQEGLWESKPSLVYRVRFRTAKDTQRNSVSKKPTKQTKTQINKWVFKSRWRMSGDDYPS